MTDNDTALSTLDSEPIDLTTNRPSDTPTTEIPLQFYGAPGHQIQPDPKQIYGTPPDFMSWVNSSWGERNLDACAIQENAKADVFLGPPGYRPETIDPAPGCPRWIGEDGLKQDWVVQGLSRARVWCNPGFENVTPWLQKALDESLRHNAHVLVLTHASTGPWFREFQKHARVWLPYPRINFDAAPGVASSSNPRDSMLWEFDRNITVGCIAVPEEWPRLTRKQKAALLEVPPGA